MFLEFLPLIIFLVVVIILFAVTMGNGGFRRTGGSDKRHDRDRLLGRK